MENEYGTKEEQDAAEKAALYHFRDGRDKYELLVQDVLKAFNNPNGISPEQSLGAFLKGIAKNNFYYGYIFGLRSLNKENI